MKNRPVLSYILAANSGFVFYTLGYAVGVPALSHLPFPPPTILEHPVAHPLTDMLAAYVVALGVSAIAGIFRGPFLTRRLLLFFFIYILGHLISAWEAAYFTKFGGTSFFLALGVFPSLFGAIGITLFLGPSGPVEPFLPCARDYFKNRPPLDWLWRLGLVWLSFPAIYLLFGFCVAPIVLPYYHNLEFLVVPPLGTLVELQLCRSLLILAALLPLFVYWKGPKGRLILLLGSAFYALTGLSGLLAGSFLPTVIRWAHGVETLADALAYSTVAVLLLSSRKPS